MLILQQRKLIFQMIYPCLFCSSEEQGYFEGVLLCKDDEVAAFVEDIQKRAKHVRVFVFLIRYFLYFIYLKSNFIVGKNCHWLQNYMCIPV